jgi:hypothetical protein
MNNADLRQRFDPVGSQVMVVDNRLEKFGCDFGKGR